MGMKDSDKDRMIDISAAGGKRKGTGRHGFANRASPKPSFYLKHVPVFEEQDPFQYYDFTSVAGKGGYATVYMVQNLETGQEFACKVVHTRDSQERVERAMKEACMQSILSEHPNVTTLKEVWTFGLKHVFLVMDKCEGGELFDAIVAREFLPEKEAASVVRVIFQLIRWGKQKGILNHDLKPENFMFKDKSMGFEKKNVRAVDFGSAAFYDEPTKKLSGTPLYAAPEIIKGPHHDHRADLWSAGIILFCMLTGLMPFEGETNHELKHAVLTQSINFEEDPWPSISNEAKDLCKRLLKRNPDERILLDDALSHPWLKQNLLNSSKSLIEAKLESLQNFATMPELSRLLLLLYANKLGKDQGDSDACFGLFNWMICSISDCVNLGKIKDRNGDEQLTVSDLKYGLYEFGLELPDHDIKELFMALSVTNENTISFKEFHCAILDREILDNSSGLRNLFSQDMDAETEYIRVEDIHREFQDSNVLVSEDRLEHLSNMTDSQKNLCFSWKCLEDAWSACKHTRISFDSECSSSSDIELETIHRWSSDSQ